MLKNKIYKALVCVCIVLILTGCNEEVYPNTQMTTENASETITENQNTTEQAPTTSVEEENEGGNPDKSSESVPKRIISILVSEESYYYQNERVEYEDILNIINDQSDKNFFVEIIDDNATQKAYSKVVDKLKELEIEYIEK